MCRAGQWKTDWLCVVRAVRVLATVWVGTVSSTAAISTGLVVAAVRVATVAAVLVVAGHVCRVAVSRTDGRLAGLMFATEDGAR
jgi:hypothetical protein